MQKLGKADETRDAAFEEMVANFNKQTVSSRSSLKEAFLIKMPFPTPRGQCCTLSQWSCCCFHGCVISDGGHQAAQRPEGLPGGSEKWVQWRQHCWLNCCWWREFCMCLPAMHDASRRLQDCLADMYEPEWFGKEEMDTLAEVRKNVEKTKLIFKKTNFLLKITVCCCSASSSGPPLPRPPTNTFFSRPLHAPLLPPCRRW